MLRQVQDFASSPSRGGGNKDHWPAIGPANDGEMDQSRIAVRTLESFSRTASSMSLWIRDIARWTDMSTQFSKAMDWRFSGLAFRQTEVAASCRRAAKVLASAGLERSRSP